MVDEAIYIGSRKNLISRDNRFFLLSLPPYEESEKCVCLGVWGVWGGEGIVMSLISLCSVAIYHKAVSE